jgi:hypothetical protein
VAEQELDGSGVAFLGHWKSGADDPLPTGASVQHEFIDFLVQYLLAAEVRIGPLFETLIRLYGSAAGKGIVRRHSILTTHGLGLRRRLGSACEDMRTACGERAA